jgi:hypothetical protein
MALMPEGASPFTKLDKQGVIGILKATGSRDPDVLHAQKERMLAHPKNLKMLAIICFACGGLLTLTIFMAFFGIPIVLFGWWLWNYSAKNITAVETGYAEYVGSLRTQTADMGDLQITT